MKCSVEDGPLQIDGVNPGQMGKPAFKRQRQRQIQECVRDYRPEIRRTADGRKLFVERSGQPIQSLLLPVLMDAGIFIRQDL